MSMVAAEIYYARTVPERHEINKKRKNARQCCHVNSAPSCGHVVKATPVISFAGWQNKSFHGYKTIFLARVQPQHPFIERMLSTI